MNYWSWKRGSQMENLFVYNDLLVSFFCPFLRLSFLFSLALLWCNCESVLVVARRRQQVHPSQIIHNANHIYVSNI